MSIDQSEKPLLKASNGEDQAGYTAESHQGVFMADENIDSQTIRNLPPTHANDTAINSQTPPRSSSVGRQFKDVVSEKDAQTTSPPEDESAEDCLLTAEEAARRLNVSKDWVWDHSSRKAPFLPVIRLGDGTLRYRASRIEEFINERERLSALRRKRR